MWWLGQAGFQVREASGGPRIVIDPYLVERPDRTWAAPMTPAELAQVDYVLSTHEHRDHFDEPSLKTAAETPGSRFTLVVPEPLREKALGLGLPPERVKGLQPGQELNLGGSRLQCVPARHGVNVSDAYNFGEELSGGLIRYLGYVLTVGGVTLYHAGDCIPYEGQVERIKEMGAQVAMLPINGRDYFRETERNLVGNFDPREATRLAVEIGAEVLIPMHWELFPHNLGFTSHLAEFAAEKFPELSLLVMGRGKKVVWG
jgi:L-ascorbate metabolism protein UlaG (beta-lactamase superfamily)